MPVPISVVDAFTDRPFAGNPAGVCLLEVPASEDWMQAVAAEVNLSETAFVVPRADGDHDLRWFTPAVEVDLCGHATLAAAHVLGGAARFHTRSGLLTCDGNADGSIALDLPATIVEAGAPTEGWAEALGLPGEAVVACSAGSGWVLVELRSAADVAACVPDRSALVALGGHAVAVADTSADPASEFDTVCRTFVPLMGIDEDPVTGAAHCVIAPWIAGRTGRTTFRAHQASARGGVLGLALAGDRVQLTGHAVTVWTGSLHADPTPA